MSQVSFAEASMAETQASMQQSLSRSRKLLGKAQEAIAEQIPEEADTGPGLQWLSLDHWEETMTEELMALGAALMDEVGDVRSASRCYARAYEIASQPAPPKKDPFDPDPEPIRRAKWWPCETQCRSALCVAACTIAVESDPTMLAAGTLDEVRIQLAMLDAIAKDVVTKSEKEPVNNWLLYNVSVRIYSVLQDALERGMAGPALASLMPPLLWVAAAIESSPSVCGPAYAPWRVQLATAVCRGFDGVGQPSLALKFCTRLAERLQAIGGVQEGTEEAEMLASAIQSLAVVQFRYSACADPASAATPPEIEALPAKFAAIVEGLAGLATPSDIKPLAEGEEAPPPASLSAPAARRRTLDRAAPDESQTAAVEALVAAGQAVIEEHFPATEAEEPAEGEEASAAPMSYTASEAGQAIAVEAHAAFVKWCFTYKQEAAFAALYPALQWRLANYSQSEAHHMLAMEIEVMVEMTKPEFSGSETPVKYADALYALAEIQATSQVAGCSDLVYDGAIMLWHAVEGAAAHENGEVDPAEDGMLRPEESDDRLRGGALARCLLVVWKCLTISEADDAILCASVALRLSGVWEARASGDAEVVQLAIEVAERGVADLEQARSKYIEGKDVAWTLSASTADGEDELYQRLCCLHVELLNKTFYLKLLQGRDNFRLYSERSHAKTLKALEKRQGLQPLYGMRTEKQAEAESLALGRPPPRPSFDPKTEALLTKDCGQNTYQQALLLCQMARFRDTKAERTPLLTKAVELLNAAERKEQMAAEHWADFAAEGADPSAPPTKTPIAPILLSRTHNSITLYAPRFKLTKSAKYWSLYGKDAGPGTGCAMTNTELEETGSLREASALGPVTIGGLQPNEAYVFATAAFNGQKKVISGIGLTCVPIVAMHPLPVKLCQGYAAVLAFELGCQLPATKSLMPLRKAFIVDAPQSTPPGVAEPGRAACKLPGIILDQERALRSSPAMLRAFAQALLLSVSPPGLGVTPYLVTKPPKDKETRELAPGPQVPMLSTMDDIRTLLVGLDISCAIKDDELTMQIAVCLYEVLAPMTDAYQKPIHLLPAIARGYEALATIDPSSLSPVDDGSQQDLTICAAGARKALCCFAYQLLEITAEAHAAPAANLAVEEVVVIVRNSMDAWAAAKAAAAPPPPPDGEEAAEEEAAPNDGEGGGTQPSDSRNPWAMPEWDALLGYVLALPPEIAGEDLSGLTKVAVVTEDEAAQEKAGQLAEIWTQFRTAGPAAAIESAKVLAGEEDKAEFLRLAAKICDAALSQGKLEEAVEQCVAALADVTKLERDQVVTLPEIEIYEPEPEPEEGAEEPVEEEELDEEAKAAKAEAEAAALQEKLDGERERAANKLQQALSMILALRNSKRKARAQIANETPWRASLETSLAFGEFIKWRDAGAASGLPEPVAEGEEPAEPAAEEGEEGDDSGKPWLSFLQRSQRAVVLASRGSNWIQMENCCRNFQNIAVWLRTHLPVEAGVDNELDKLVKEISGNAVRMLLVLKEDVEAQLALEEQEAMMQGKSAVSSSSSGSNDYWFSGLACPDVRWMARHVIWCLQLCLEPKLKQKADISKDGTLQQKEVLAAEFGAVADVAGRLNFVTEDVYAEEVLPMIIKAKTALGEQSDHAKGRLQMAIRDKPMARETLDISRDIMHKLRGEPESHAHIASKFASTIQLLRDKRETLLCCQALNELGDFHWGAGRKDEAGVAWADGIDAAFGTYASLKEWRDVLGGQDGTEQADAALIKQFGVMECVMAVTMLGKCAKFVYNSDTYLRTECCRFAARVCHVMFSCDVSHPHKLREFATYRLRQLWEGVPIFENSEVAASNLLVDALDTVCNELDAAGSLLPALPVLALYQHVAVDAMEDLYYSLRCATVRVRVLSQAGFLEQATATLRDLVTGVELPGVEAKVSTELPGVELLKNELPPQAQANLDAITSACGGVLPELPGTVLDATQRDSIDCGLVLAQELLRLQLAAAAPPGAAGGEARESLLSAAEARFVELRDSRVGTEVERPAPEDDPEAEPVMATIFSPLDVRTRCEAELGIAQVHELRMLHRLALVQANTVMAFMQERELAYAEEAFDDESKLFAAQESFVGSDVWLRCRLLSIRCHTASRRYDDARQACATTVEEAEGVHDAARACEAEAASAAIDALCGDPNGAQEKLQAVASRMRKLSLVDESYAVILMRLAEIHDKQGRPAQASDLLWQADNVLKSVSIGDEGVTGYGVMTGAAGHSLLAPAEVETLPLRHSLYLPPALPWARVHSALGCLSAAQADSAAAESHLAFAAFVASTDVPACPPRFRAAMLLALGRQSRRKIGTAGFGGSFLPEAPPPPEGEEEPPAPEKHPLFETVSTQLTTALEVAMNEAGHPHSLMREALLELVLLRGMDDPRAAAALLSAASSLTDMKGKLDTMLSAIPAGAGVNLPPFLQADLEESRQTDDSGAADDRPITATDLIQYYISLVYSSETAGTGSGLDVDAKLAATHAEAVKSCPLLAEICLTAIPKVEETPPVAASTVSVMWYASDPQPKNGAMPKKRKVGEFGQEEEEPRRVSLAERLGLPGSLPAQVAPADAAETTWAVWCAGPLAPAEGEEESSAPEAALGCTSVEVGKARQIHRNLTDLLHQMREDALVAPPEEPAEGEAVDPLIAEKQKITEGFWAECLGEIKALFKGDEPVAEEAAEEAAAAEGGGGGGGAALPVALTMENVTAVEAMMNSGVGGKAIAADMPGAPELCAYMRTILL